MDRGIDTIDPYAVLNVSNNAGIEDIRAAYKKACMLYHPDKHSSNKKPAAALLFSKIQTSYSILSDSDQRKIYDQLGWDGITKSWQLGPQLSGIESINRALEEEKRRLFSRPMVSKTTIQTQVDASGVESLLVQDADSEDNDLILLDYLPGVKGVSVGQRFEQVFDNGLVGTLSLDVLSKAGMGSGSISGQLVKAIGPFSKASIGYGMGSRKYISTSYSKQVIKNTSISLAFTGIVHGGAIFPSFQASINRLFCEKYLLTAALVTERSAKVLQSATNGVVIAGQFIDENKPLTVSCHLKSDGHIKLDLKHSIVINEHHTLKMKVSTLRPKLSIGLTRKFAEGVKGAVGVEFSYDLGSVFKFAFTRYDYHFVVPVIISPDLTSFSILLATVIPTVLMSAIKAIYNVYEKRQARLCWEEYRQARMGAIMKRKEEAIIAQWLMEDRFNTSLADAQLKIIRAVYREQNREQDNGFDVKIPLQLAVSDHSLNLAANSLRFMIGSYDVAIGVDKEVFIEYEYNGVKHACIIPDHLPIIIPQKSHIKS